MVLRRRRIVGLGLADLELHSLVEEEIPIVPELVWQEGLELVYVVEGDDVARLEGGGAGPRILSEGQGRYDEGDETEKNERFAATHGLLRFVGH